MKKLMIIFYILLVGVLVRAEVRTIEPSYFRMERCFASTISQPGEESKTDGRNFSVFVQRYKDGSLLFEVKNFLAECEGEYLLEATVEGNCITLNPYITNPSQSPCYCRRNMYFGLPNVITETGDYFIKWEGQPKENGIISLAFKGRDSISAGFYRDEVKSSLYSLDNKIIILYNPGDESHKPYHAHIFVYTDLDGSLCVNLNGIGMLGNQTKIGSLRAEGCKVYLTPGDIEIPAEFWGINLGIKTMNPAKILGTEEILLYDFSDATSEDVYVFDFLKGELKDCKRVFTHCDDGFNPKEISFNLNSQLELPSPAYIWRDYRHDFASDKFYGSQHRSVGTFGKGIASNPIYPIYELQEGVVPTSLSCVGEIGCDAHGSIPFWPTYYVDDNWKTDICFNNSSIQSVNEERYCKITKEGNVLHISAEGYLAAQVITINGDTITQTVGEEALTINLGDICPQLIFVLVETQQGYTVRKFMISGI